MKRKNEKMDSSSVDLPPVPNTVLSNVFTSTADRWFRLCGFAQENRKRPAKAEVLLWGELRNKKLGDKFRRQHAFDFLIVDFVCIAKRLVIEVDGDTHLSDDQKKLDADRTAYLNYQGYEVMRFSNEEIYQDLIRVVNTITLKLKSKPIVSKGFLPSPLERGRG